MTAHPARVAYGGDFYNKDYTKTLVNDQKGRQALQFGFAPIPKGPGGTTPSSQTWTNQWSMVKTTPINTETAEVWKKTQANELGVNDALSQVEQIVNRLLASS